MHANSSTSVWTRWKPTDEQPWNVRRVVHLHRRVGFAANWAEIQRDLRDGPEAAIDRLLKPAVKDSRDSAARSTSYTSATETSSSTSSTGGGADFFQMASAIGDAAVGSGSPNRLKAWWLYRMLFSPDPLSERLTLMWHNHFATSNLKVANIELMRQQNQSFREFGRGTFGDLAQRAAKDPALLIWLDADANRKEHPNENLARELMELFTLGVGNYSEVDVREAARALTGWSVKDGRFRDFAHYHDDGQKTLFGKTGAWTGDDLMSMLIDNPATAKRIAFRLCEQFMGENVVRQEELGELAAMISENRLDIGQAVETIVRSELFFSERNIGNRVLSPVEFIVNTVRSLELLGPPPSTLLLAEWTTTLGQDLFYPPNVFGWPGGRGWLTTRSLIGRSNFVTSLIGGVIFKPQRQLALNALADKYDYAGRSTEFFGPLLTGLDPASPLLNRLLADQKVGDPPRAVDVILAILNSPHAVLG